MSAVNLVRAQSGQLRTVFKQLVIIAALMLILCGCREPGERTASMPGPENEASQSSLEVVRFGMLPYGDHTYAIIGVKKGWFKEAGIDFQYKTVKVEDVIPYLKNGTLDAASLPPGILYSSYENAPEMCSFVFGDLFQGYTIMGQPGCGYRSCQDLAREGATPSESVKKVVEQLKGKTFAYPAETAIKPFVDLCMKKGGLTIRDIKPLVLDDPLTINAMRNKQADFQVGGAPSRIILEREGFKPLLNSLDIASTAKPSPDSPELASILQDGWVTTKQYYKEHHDTILRLASVNFRIIRFINEHPQEALSLHMPYLSQVTGQKFSEQDGLIIYERLDPFFTFEAQHDWFHTPNSLCYYRNVNGSILNNFISQKIYKNAPPTVEDVVWCEKLYKEMENLKAESAKNLDQLKRLPITELKGARDELQKAQDFFDHYNFLDAKRSSDILLKRLAYGR